MTMTPELIAQARRALASPRWRPMDGMQWAVRAAWTGMDVWARWRPGLKPPEEARPCFDDPATVGCLLALVREAYADPHKLWGGRVEVHQDPHGSFVVVQPHRDATRGFLEHRIVATGPTEVDALLNALEAAP